jgi:K-box region
MGEDLSGLNIKDLHLIENQLELNLNTVRKRKVHLKEIKNGAFFPSFNSQRTDGNFFVYFRFCRSDYLLKKFKSLIGR